MLSFWIWLLIGGGIGLVVLPIFMLVYNLIANTLEKRKIKRMIKNKQFIIPIDTKDYDKNTWSNEINPNDYKQELADLDKDIFARRK